MRFDVIYAPKGPALEYSAWACNIVKSTQRGGKGPKSCSHNCAYCYNPPGTEDGPVLKDNIIYRLGTDLRKLKDVIKPGEKLEFTFVGDLYDPKIPKGVARSCLLACKKAGIPFQVLTKNGITSQEDFSLYGSDDLFGVTLTCDNDEDSLKWEPGACLWKDRIDALKSAHEKGIHTWVSFEPVIDPDQTLHLIEIVAPFVDRIKVGKMNSRPNQTWHSEEVKKIAQDTDWEKFGENAISILEKLGKEFYIKDDLARKVPQHRQGRFSKMGEVHKEEKMEVPISTNVADNKEVGSTSPMGQRQILDKTMNKNRGIGVNLPLPTLDLPPCIEYAIQYSPSPNEEMDWCITLTQFWRFYNIPPKAILGHLLSVSSIDEESMKEHIQAAWGLNKWKKIDCKVLRSSFKKGCRICEHFSNSEEVTDQELFSPRIDSGEIINASDIANQLVQGLDIKRLPGGVLAVYQNGIYKIEDADLTLDAIIKNNLENGYNTKLRSNILLHVRAAATPVVWDDFEKYPSLLCCTNGVVDLTTKKLLPFSPEYMMLWRTKVGYHPDSACDLYKRTMEEVLEPIGFSSRIGEVLVDESFLDYYQKVFGYSLTGETRNEFAFIHQGLGGSGKNTLIWPIQVAMGTYSKQIDPDILMSKNDYFKADYDLANTVGRRMIVTNESKDGAHLNTQLIKRVASEGQKFNARQIRQEPIEFTMKGKVHMMMNPIPVFEEQDRAIKRRLHLIQYPADFTANANLTLKQDIVANELPGILTWLVDGAYKYYTEGLRPVKRITDAIDEIMMDSDPLDGFGDAHLFKCEMGIEEPFGVIIKGYTTYCYNNGISTTTFDHHKFGRDLNTYLKMNDFKFKRRKVNGKIYYNGVDFRD
jgi:P4 family phage/plasmid primase-like protien